MLVQVEREDAGDCLVTVQIFHKTTHKLVNHILLDHIYTKSCFVSTLEKYMYLSF